MKNKMLEKYIETLKKLYKIVNSIHTNTFNNGPVLRFI